MGPSTTEDGACGSRHKALAGQGENWGASDSSELAACKAKRCNTRGPPLSFTFPREHQEGRAGE